MATINSLSAPPARYHPEHITYELGMKQLALCFLRNVFEDCQGRGPRSDRNRRLNSARAIVWLRSRETYLFSLVWCCEILGVDAGTIANNGIACVPFSGLKNWRRWREQRGLKRVFVRPLLRKRCPACSRYFSTREPNRIACSSSCARIRTITIKLSNQGRLSYR